MDAKRMQELSDEELQNVSGGGCSQYTSFVIDGKRYKRLPNGGNVNGCSSFVCCSCGSGKGKHHANCCATQKYDADYCNRCKYAKGGSYCVKFYKNE